jgi:hypothetical protein
VFKVNLALRVLLDCKVRLGRRGPQGRKARKVMTEIPAIRGRKVLKVTRATLARKGRKARRGSVLKNAVLLCLLSSLPHSPLMNAMTEK